MKMRARALAAACLLAGCGSGTSRDLPSVSSAIASGPDGFDGSSGDFFSGQYGLTADQADLRGSAEIQLGDLAGFEGANPAAFGGAWIDETAAGGIHISLVNPSAAQISAARAGFPAGYPVDVQTAAFTEAQLEAWLDALPDSASMNWAAVDEEANKITVAALPGGTAAVTALLLPVLPAGSFQVIEDGDVIDDTGCVSRNNCGHPLRGGIEINPDDQNDDTCSLGFIAAGPEGHHYALTAAHCAPSGHTYSVASDDENILRQIGAVGHRQFAGPLDVSAIKLQAPWDDDAAGYIFQTSSMKKIAVTASLTRKNVHKGMLLCRNGYRTGQICAAVSARNARVKRRSGRVFTHQILLKACSLPGDSGGPIYQPISTIDHTTHSIDHTVKSVGIENASNFHKGTPPTCNASPISAGSYVGEYNAATDIHVVHL